MSDRQSKWIGILLMGVVLSGLWMAAVYQRSAEDANSLAQGALLWKLSQNYRLRQVFFCVIVAISGRVFTEFFLTSRQPVLKWILAFPVGNLVYSICACLMLILGIPYNRITFVGSAVITLGAAGLWILKKGRVRELLSVDTLIGILAVIFVINLIGASGINLLMSYDSHYYTYQYGRLMAQLGRLDYDSMANLLMWIGISSATMSAMASLAGFESIYFIHGLLVVSMIAALLYFLRDYAMKKDLGSKANLVTGIAAVLLLFSIPLRVLGTYVIVNTYFMVYMFLAMILPFWMEKTGQEKDDRTAFLLAVILSWLIISRAEAAVTVVFLIVVLSKLTWSRRQMLILTIPPMAVEVGYLLRLYYMYSTHRDKYVANSQYNIKVVLIIGAVVAAALVYALFYETGLFQWVRKNMSYLGFGGFAVAIGGIFLLNREKSVSAFWIFADNMMNTEFWGHFTVMMIVLGVILALAGQLDGFMLLSTLGFILCNYLICNWREQPFRSGLGDSGNRIFMSVVPIIWFMVLFALVNLYAQAFPAGEGKNDETDHTDSVL